MIKESLYLRLGGVLLAFILITGETLGDDRILSQAEIDRLMRIPAKLSFAEARGLLARAGQPEGIATAYLESDVGRPLVQKPFFRISATQTDWGPPFYPRYYFGVFAVNAWTGDVWGPVGGDCGDAVRLTPAIADQTRRQLSYRLTATERRDWAALRSFRPDCPEDEGRAYTPPSITALLQMPPNITENEAKSLMRTIYSPFYFRDPGYVPRLVAPEEGEVTLPFMYFTFENERFYWKDYFVLAQDEVFVNPWTGDVWLHPRRVCATEPLSWPGLYEFQARLKQRLGPEQRRLFETQRQIRPPCNGPDQPVYHHDFWVPWDK